MADNESLEAKYGRKKSTSAQSGDNKNNDVQQETKQTGGFFSKYGGFENKYKNENERQQNIRRNIAETLSEYNTNEVNKAVKDNDINQQPEAKDVAPKKETPLVKFLKVVVMILIVLVVACTVIAFIMRDKVNVEGAEIIDQINNAEAMYYSIYKKYYYFSKTAYDSTLGIDMSIYKFFNYYEVIYNDETGNYEIKLYGSTNAFTITYHTIKAFLNK